MSNPTATQPKSPKTGAKRRQPPFAVRLGIEADRALVRLAEDLATSKTDVIRTAILDAEQRHAEQRQAGVLESLREIAMRQGVRQEALVSIVRQIEIDLKGRLDTQEEALRAIEQVTAIAAMRLQSVVEESSNPRIRERAAQLISQLQS